MNLIPNPLLALLTTKNQGITRLIWKPHLFFPIERDNNNGISNDETTLAAKRQRSVSSRSFVRHRSTSPLPHSRDPKGSQENIDPDEWRDDDSKRQRLFSHLSGKTASNRYKNRSQHSPSPTSEEEKENGTLSASVNSEPASTTAISSAASEPALPTELQQATQWLDASQDWEVRKIIGKEDINGVQHYLVVFGVDKF